MVTTTIYLQLTLKTLIMNLIKELEMDNIETI